MSELKYVQIPSPVNSRKALLGGAIDIIQFLKDYEKVLQVKKEKQIYLNQCKRNFAFLKQEFIEINKLPKVDMANLEKHELPVDKNQVIDIKKLKKKAQVSDRELLKEQPKQKKMDKLQSDMDMLKAKLASL